MRSVLARLRARRLLGWLRVLVVALIFPLASGGTLPGLARLAGVEGPHVCRCAADHHDCVCARCHPDRDEMRVSEASLKGQCGDDETAFAGKVSFAVGHAPFVTAERAELVGDVPEVARSLEGRDGDPPPPRPPRG